MADENAGPSSEVDRQWRTVYINHIPAPLLTSESLKNYLQAIYNTSVLKALILSHKKSPIGSETNHKYALVEFESIDAVQKAIAAKCYWLNGKPIRMKGRKAPSYVPPTVSSAYSTPPLDEQYPSVLDNFAPEYLFHIYQYLEPLDVAHLAETSEYLANFSEAHICKKYADCRIFDDSIQFYDWEQFNCILRHFGAHFKRLSLDGYTFDDGGSERHVASVLQQCPNVDELRLANFTFEAVQLQSLAKMQSSVKHLVFDQIEINRKRRKTVAHWPANVNALSICRIDDDFELAGDLVNGVQKLERLQIVIGQMDSQKMFKRLNKHRDTLRNLSLIEMDEVSHERYKDLGTMLPQLELLQISISDARDLRSVAGMHLKYLQLNGSPKNAVTMENWSLHDLPVLEELELVHVNGKFCSVVTSVPTIRVLSLQCTKIESDHGLGATIAKLPNLQSLCIRKSLFDPQEIVTLLVETNCQLKEIVLELPPREATRELLVLLGKTTHPKTPSDASSATYELRIIVDQIDPTLFELSRQLPYVHWVLEKNKPAPRFDSWDKLIEQHLDDMMEMQYDMDPDNWSDDDYSDDFDNEYYDDDDDDDDDLLLRGNHHVLEDFNDNGLDLGNAILHDIFNNYF